MEKFFACLIIIFAAVPLPASDINSDVVLNAMSKELKRSFDNLKNAEKTPLYFLGYEIMDNRKYHVTSEMGAISSNEEKRERSLNIDIRVNNPEFDNTHQFKGDYGWGVYEWHDYLPVAIEEREDSLRARVWEYTDKAFKKAQESFTKVQMNKAITAEEEDPSNDFSAAPVETYYEDVKFPEIDKKFWQDKLNKYTSEFKKHPFIYKGNAWLSVETVTRYIVHSEGTKIKTGQTYVSLSYFLMSRTTDGMDLQRYESYHGAATEELPTDEVVLKDMEKSINELRALKNAPIVEPYSGPAILKARAAGVYFHEIIGHRLEGHRQKIEEEGQTFAKKINQKVTADFITLYDDPTVEQFKGKFLRGHYKYDDQGVRAQKAMLVDKGVLKGFLMSRSPIKNFTNSNGHGRRSSGRPVVARMGNTMVESSATTSLENLRKMLIDECKKQNKPFGLIFEDIAGGWTMTQRWLPQSFKVLPLLVYKVYADSRPDEVVRGVDIVGTPIASFNKIIAAADDYDIFNGTCGAESGWVPVSSVSPSLLVSEIEVEKSQKSQEKPPVLVPPLHDK
jgi:TldD protein